jgi:hypothetical protein
MVRARVGGSQWKICIYVFYIVKDQWCCHNCALPPMPDNIPFDRIKDLFLLGPVPFLVKAKMKMKVDINESDH